MENEKMVYKWLETKFGSLDKLLDAVEKKCSDCRVHCDASREKCLPRIEALERTIAEMRSATWKGAIFIGTCGIIGVIAATLITYMLRGGK